MRMTTMCIHCGRIVETGGFFDKRLIHMRHYHPNMDIGAGWSFWQRLLVR